MQDFLSNIYIIPTENGKSVKVCFEQEPISEEEAVERFISLTNDVKAAENFTHIIKEVKAMNEPKKLNIVFSGML